MWTLLTRLFKLALVGILVVVLAGIIYTSALYIQRSSPLSLPVPTGPYAVGRIQYQWTDTSRADPLADHPTPSRELLVWVWYPAMLTSQKTPAPYLPPAWVKARNQDQGIGYLIEYDFSTIETHAFENVPLADSPGTFPVLMMEPGMGPSAPDYTVLAENLASQGYVVFGINVTDTSNLVVFPDGRVMTRTNKGIIPDSADAAEADQDAIRIGAVWADDMTFVMNQLARVNTDPASPFHNRLDLAHMGMWGHSFGGATSIAICQRDPRCGAGVDMDGTPWGTEATGAIPRPFMFLAEDYTLSCDSNCEAMQQASRRAPGGAAYWFPVKGARHFNFSDLPLRQAPLVRPLFSAAGFTGSVDPTRGLQIANAYLTAFFDRYLRNMDSPLLHGPAADFPEVQFNLR